jgi:putative serine protease PepD
VILRRLVSIVVLLAALAALTALFILPHADVFFGSPLAGPKLPPGKARELTRHVLPSVVDVHVTSGSLAHLGEMGVGTGVVFSADGTIVTNDHVVTAEGGVLGDQVTVVTKDGRSLHARVVARAPAFDLAVLRVAPGVLPPALFESTYSLLRRGQPIIAIGAPHSLRRSIARGRIVAVTHTMRLVGRSGLTSILRVSARLHPGYSGGPIVDRRGRVAGISMAVVRIDGRSEGLAIPAPLVLSVVKRLIRIHAAAGEAGVAIYAGS